MGRRFKYNSLICDIYALSACLVQNMSDLDQKTSTKSVGNLEIPDLHRKFSTYLVGVFWFDLEHDLSDMISPKFLMHSRNFRLIL